MLGDLICTYCKEKISKTNKSVISKGKVVDKYQNTKTFLQSVNKKKVIESSIEAISGINNFTLL